MRLGSIIIRSCCTHLTFKDKNINFNGYINNLIWEIYRDILINILTQNINKMKFDKKSWKYYKIYIYKVIIEILNYITHLAVEIFCLVDIKKLMNLGVLPRALQ